MNRPIPKKRHPKKATARRTEDAQIFSPSILLKSMLITLGVGIALLVMASLCAYFFNDPNQLILPLGLTASAMTAFIGGIVSIRMQGHSALLCGLCNGAAVCAVMILASLFFKSLSSGYSALVSAALHAGFLCLSVAGAYLGQKRGKKPQKRRR